MSPWWSFNSLKRKLGRFQFLLLLMFLVLSCLYAGYRFGAVTNKWQIEQIQTQKKRLENLYQELDNKIRQINYLSVELEVEQNANNEIQRELLQIRQESFELRRELNFYQKVVAPELVADGISVEQFSAEPTNLEGRYHFQFALVQTDSQRRYAKGYIRIKLLGVKGDEKVSLDLAELAKMSKSDLDFSFHYFQYFEGEFELPQGVIAEHVEVKVIQPKTKWQRYKASTQTLEWPVINNQDETPIILD